MLTLLGTQYAKAEILTKRTNGLFLNESDLKDLAAYKKNCDVLNLNLQSTESKLNKCIASGSDSSYFLKQQNLVIGGFVVSFGVGLALGALLIK